MRRRWMHAASFVAVGATAAAVHLAVVMLVVRTTGLPPLAANIAGWLVAFNVSFLGQWRLTFRAQAAPMVQAARRFFLVSALGFAVNESAYALMLRLTGWRYDLVLAGVLVGVAITTYILSAAWAFRGSVPAGSSR